MLICVLALTGCADWYRFCHSRHWWRNIGSICCRYGHRRYWDVSCRPLLAGCNKNADLIHLPEWTFDRKRISANSNSKAQKRFREDKNDVIFRESVKTPKNAYVALKIPPWRQFFSYFLHDLFYSYFISFIWHYALIKQ